MKREKAEQQQLDVFLLTEDEDLIRQVQASSDDQKFGRVFGKEAGLDYLRAKVKEFEHEQNL